MYTERKTSMQYPQPFSVLSCLTGTNNLVSKNNFIKNVKRARGRHSEPAGHIFNFATFVKCFQAFLRQKPAIWI